MLHALPHVPSGLHPGCSFFFKLHFEFIAVVWVCFFIFFWSDKPSVKWCHGDSSSCSILMWQIKSCRWQVYRQLYLGKCTHGLSTSKYFPLEKNINVIYGWCSVREITPWPFYFFWWHLVSCLSSELCFDVPPHRKHLPPNPPQKINLTQLSSIPLTLFIQLSKVRNGLSCQGFIRNKCTTTLASLSAGWLIRLYWCTTAAASSS